MGFLSWIIDRIASRVSNPTPQPSPSPSPIPTPLPTPSPAFPGIVAALNEQRIQNGLAPLAENARLDAMATAWAQQMAWTKNLTHGDFSGRIAGVFPKTSAGEDIAEGATTVAGVVALWMNSPPHRANILGPYTTAGAGTAAASDGSIYWCVDFDNP